MGPGQRVRTCLSSDHSRTPLPSQAHPLFLWNLTPAVPVIFRLTCGMVFCIYLDRRPKIGVKAVSMSSSSTSPAIGDLDKGIGG